MFVLVAAMVLNLIGTPAHAASVLTAGQTLYVGDQLSIGPYRLILQTGGNLVLYWNSYALWATGTTDVGYASPVHRLVMYSSGDLALRRADNSLAWHTGTAGSGAGNATLVWNGELRVGHVPGLGAIWSALTAEQTYSTNQPDNAYHTFCYEASVTPSIAGGYGTFLANVLNQPDVDMTGIEEPCNSSTDVRVKRLPLGVSGPFAQTHCSMQLSANVCEQNLTEWNSDRPHPNSAAVACHETGHTLNFPDYVDQSKNDHFRSAEQNCERGGPDVVKYSERQKAHINARF